MKITLSIAPLLAAMTASAISSTIPASAAVSGNVITLPRGVHYGEIVIADDNTVLRGEVGAIVNANDISWKPVWTKAPEFGRLAWSSPIPFEPGAVSVDDRVMIDAREARGGLALHDGGIGADSRIVLQGVWTYVRDSRLIVVSFPDGASPAARKIEASRKGAAAVSIRGANNVRVEGLIITGGETGVSIMDSDGVVVERNFIYGHDVGVRLGKGASNCKVISNDITMNPDALNLDAEKISVGKAVWHAHKRQGTYDKWCVLADSAGDNNEVAHNYLYNGWDGVENLSGVDKADVRAHYENNVLKGVSPFNNGLRVHHNRVDLMMDDALEPNDLCVRQEWFSNFVTRARVAVRVKNVSLGPLKFYGNYLSDSGTGLRFYKSSPECANVEIFGNTIRDDSAIIYLEMNKVCWNDPWLEKAIGRGTPGFVIYDNYFECRAAFDNQAGDVPPNFKARGNVFTCPRPAEASVSAAFDDSNQFGGKVETLPRPPVFPVTVSGLWDVALKLKINIGERAVEDFTIEGDTSPLKSLWRKHVPGAAPINGWTIPSAAPASTAPAAPVDGWLVSGDAKITSSAGVLRADVVAPSKTQGSLAKTVEVSAGAKFVFSATVESSQKGAAFLQVKFKNGKKELSRISSDYTGATGEKHELRIECAVPEGADNVSLNLRFSQKAAGDWAQFSNIKIRE